MRRGVSLTLRSAILVAGAIATSGVSPAIAALPPGCANPNDSALNQYCDSLPVASGGQSPPKLGGPAVQTILPARVIHQIESGRTATRVSARARGQLLRLPAPARPTQAGTGPGDQGSFPTWLLCLLAASALILSAAALVRRRERRGDAASTLRGSPA